MKDFQIKCNIEARKKLLQNPEEIINGIDYVEVRRVLNPDIQKNKPNNSHNNKPETNSEVSISKRIVSSMNNNNNNSIILLLFLFREVKTPEIIKNENLIILGGTRIRNIGIKIAGRADEVLEDLNENEKEIIKSLSSTKRKKLIVIKPIREGDFSVYTLKLVAHNKEKPNETLPNFDPIFSETDFSFKIDCPLDFDCKVDKICPPVRFEEPVLDYMAKDYASFVKLILSRFSQIIPNWKEKSAADLTNVLVELLSYIGDHLSYYQDAISTEAYLGTAKKRISIKRHARLLDYFIGEGSNARTWVCFEVKARKEEEVKGLVLKESTKLLTGESTKDTKKILISEDDLKEIIYLPDTRVFETMHEINLYTFHNEMFFYTWGETDCCLPKGATHATLLGEIKKTGSEEVDSLDIYIFSWDTIMDNEHNLHLQEQDNLKNFIMRISSIFQDKNSITLFREDSDDRKIIKMVDNDNPSKFISIELVKKEKDLLPNDTNNNIIYEGAIAKDNNNIIIYEFMVKQSDSNNDNIAIYGLSLIIGDVLIFEEVLSPTTLNRADRDISHRQAVKLKGVRRKFDPIKRVNLVEIYWDEQDALKFPLCINKISTAHTTTNSTQDALNNHLKIISVVRGNVVLVDHGYTIKNEELEQLPESGIYYPKLDKSPITFVSPFVSSASAYASIYRKQHLANDNNILNPAILVREGPARIILGSDGHDEDNKKDKNNNGAVGVNEWYPARDLLSSDKFAKEFVVEIDNENTVFLRFGDGKNGQKPEYRITDNGNHDNEDHVKFYATYRIGNGATGNVGSDTIKRIVVDFDNSSNIVDKILNIYNPLPAIGGTDQERMDEVRQNAPIAFMKQERAVTENDYTSVLMRHPDIQRAFAIFRWTGSWYTVYVTIDRIGGKIVDESFKKEIYSFLNKFRLACYDLEINSPNYVPLDIEINVCVKPNHYPEKIKKNLLHAFSTQVLENGKLGFFHPDNFTFGQPLYLSKIYHLVMNFEGIRSIFVSKFQRMGKSTNMELEKGYIEVHSSEIIRLDNDPNFPDNGIMEFVMEGGGT